MRDKIQILKNYLQKVLKLEYLPEDNSGNLCFIHENPELRNEFRIGFSNSDLLKYFKNIAIYDKEADIFLVGSHEIMLPRNTDVFWQIISSD
ncbi:hypothetical protein [Elizabethkingia ursingii]|uniref:hypothetical protein n=1 Tax=Elizabethkingia ursingii TaxID=1756150 RepID=UPI000750C835|nr:hypothetical protein [Elizabethkingia ursingii]KUY31273.1 hypothetical protein ATB96_10295 [Elizabethkingia ursingii]MCL1673031.1 hypothetical protein [Elizabethkingia ursingii]